MTIVLMIVGLALLLIGANYLTEGASAIAKRFGISEFVIGLTIVAVGTSAPEFVVSLISTFNGSTDVAIGNILGSNIFNALMILGVTALIRPIRIEHNTLSRDIPFGLLAAVVLAISGLDAWLNGESGIITRSEGMLMLCFLVVFMVYSFITAKRDEAPAEASTIETPTKKRPIWLEIVMIGGGLAGLIYGGDLFLEYAVIFARDMGMSEAVIAVTLMAGGTSMPELITCVIAASKNKGQMALGNVIGSNISNIFLILGTCATVSPLQLGNILPIDLIILVGASLIIAVTAFTFRRNEIDRTEGVIFALLYISYIIYLLMR
ncbi:MAG: calcium/sodium antiporter [Bacteroidaceae bacterium]|nr:calcium/sodium antiporter [Bacteroidaceae bacterium]